VAHGCAVYGAKDVIQIIKLFSSDKITSLLCLAFVFILLISPVHADTCPTPEEIRDRKISKSYDWAVGENTTLKELLSVQTLYAVRIMDYDSYISCRYTTKKWPVILDGTPRAEQCRVTPTGGEWTGTDSGQLVCREKDVTKCLFNLECKKEAD
jgi:hypothetical protein